MKKRFLSLALSLFLVISLFPQVALAEDYIEVVPPQYDYADDFHEGLARVQVGEKYGFIDKTGKEVIPLQYDGAESFSEGVAIVLSYPTYGVIDKTGKVVVPFGKYGMAESNYFSDGIACFTSTIKEPWERGCINKTGKVVIPFGMYDGFWSFSEGLDMASKSGEIGYINKAGKAITPFKYNYGYPFSEGMAFVQTHDFKWGLIDKSGKEVVPPKYDYVEDFSEARAVVNIGGRIGGKYGIIDKTGKVIIPLGKYDAIKSFSEGLAAVSVGGKWYAGSGGIYIGGKWGYIDKTGREVIPLQYGEPSIQNFAAKFSEGMATIDVNGKIVFIDKTGREVIPPVYDTLGDVHEGMAYVRNGSHKYGFISVSGATPYVYEDSTPTAMPTASKVLVNDEETAFDAYTINGNNYVKLRDVAQVVSGSAKQFEVTWDGTKNAINLVSGKSYTSVGGEMVKGSGTAQVAVRSMAIVYKDGVAVTLIAYTINGNNYFKLRDLGQTFDFDVSWDGAKNAVVIDTTASYTAD